MKKLVYLLWRYFPNELQWRFWADSHTACWGLVFWFYKSANEISYSSVGYFQWGTECLEDHSAIWVPGSTASVLTFLVLLAPIPFSQALLIPNTKVRPEKGVLQGALAPISAACTSFSKSSPVLRPLFSNLGFYLFSRSVWKTVHLSLHYFNVFPCWMPSVFLAR